MPALEIEIINKLGLHARASAKFVGVAGQFKDCTIRVGRTPETTVDGKSIMAMMMLLPSTVVSGVRPTLIVQSGY